MTDRPRTWTIQVGPLKSNCYVIDGPLTPGKPVSPVRVIEWDRERVVPLIEQALTRKRWWEDLPSQGEFVRVMAEAVFDTLGGGDD